MDNEKKTEFPVGAPAKPKLDGFVDMATEPPRNVTPTTLTPAEKEALDMLGIKEGDTLPADLAKQLEAAGGHRDAKEAGKLDAEEREALRDIISKARAQESLLRQSMADIPEKAAPGVDEALREIRSGSAKRLEIEDDVSGAEESDEADEPQEPRTGSQGKLTHCPHCDWDLTHRDTVTITDADKQNYVQSWLGLGQFVKAYTLLDGAVTVHIRTLSPAELDICYRQAFLDRKSGKITTLEEFLEQVNRYRVWLQLTKVHSPTGELMLTLPSSEAAWRSEHGKDLDSETETILVRVQDVLYDKLFTNESVYRLVAQYVFKFNRLVMKLEANSDNADFWKATESAI